MAKLTVLALGAGFLASSVALAAPKINSLDTPATAALSPSNLTQSPTTQTATTQPASLFDPAKDMHVADVHRGMKGYGLTVFAGSKIDRFDVEVVDVLKDFNAKYDVVLIRCKGEYMDHVGAVEGMSGSPIYLFDSAGKPKLIGAFAYGWPLSKDPLAGVQPIEYMLRLPVGLHDKSSAADDSPAPLPVQKLDGQSSSISPDDSSPTSRAVWRLSDVSVAPWGHVSKSDDAIKEAAADDEINLGRGGMRLRPLSTPLMIGGLSQRAIDQISPLFGGSGLIPLEAGNAGGGEAVPGPAPKFEPGSVLAVPLLTGDLQFTAIGTCTDVIGGKIFGFGHPFNGEGPIDLPMGTGTIATIVANLQSSFKLGYLSKSTGTLTTDQSVGVAGLIGPVPEMIPIELHIVYADHSVDETFHFQAAVHQKFTPMVTGAALMASLTGEKNLPQYHTLDYDLTMQFSNGQSVAIDNRTVNDGGAGMAQDISLPLGAAMDNPFRPVQLSKLTGTIHVSNDAESADILSIMVPKSKYEPGDLVTAYVRYRPFQGREATMPVDIQIPRDLPNGIYHLTVSDWTRYFEEERQTSPFKFTADNAKQMFAVIKDVMAVKHNALYLRLLRRSDGVAVGRVAMPRLPSSMREVLTDSGRSDVLPFVSSVVKIQPTKWVMSGSATFAIKVKRDAKVQIPVAGGNGPAAPPAAQIQPKKGDNSKGSEK